MPKIEKTDAEWRQELAPERYRVLREKGTEPPFSGEYDHTFEQGTYRCAGCGAELFRSDDKFDSGSGWPSFTDPALADAVELRTDTSHGMVRTEAVCAKVMPGFGELMRDVSLKFVPTAILSRQTAGIRGKSLIVNLPGKPSAIRDCLLAVFPAIPYCVDLIEGPHLTTNEAVVKAFRPKAG